MVKPFWRYFLLFPFLFIALQSFSQGTSNKGTDFWVAYQGHVDNTSSRLNLFITSDKNATVNISAGGVALSPISITAGQAVPVTINPNVYTNTYLTVSDAIQNNAGIHITSDVNIIVYCHVSYAARSASSLILPVKALGNEYYAVSYTQGSNSPTSEPAVSVFSIVGVEDSTIVEIKPVSNSVGNTKLANNTFQITLNKGDVYQYKSTTDLTGTLIKSVGGCKPLAVFSGSTFDAFCETTTGGSGDPLYQQLFPTSAWGENFVTAPFYNAQHGVNDIFRIQVEKDGTIIKVNGSSTSAVGTLLNNPYAAGSMVTFFTHSPSRIEASSPISVAQIQVSQNCNPNNSGNSKPNSGDPELTILNPIEQTLSDITVYSAISTAAAPTNITQNYLNIILKSADIPTLKVDGSVPVGTFVTIDSVYSYITVDVTASSLVNPAHRITCNNGFIAIAYGYGNVESYAYLAGADLKNLNAGIEIYPTGSIVQTTALCKGEDYNVKLKLPYITNEIIWNLNNGASIDTIATPLYSFETVAGKTSYYYDYAIAGAKLKDAGIYNLKATVVNPNPTGCDAYENITTEFEVDSLPVSSFVVDKDSTCIGSDITFTDHSKGNGKQITNWYWDFGDGSSVLEKTNANAFTYNYKSPGDYQVKLSVKTVNGCSPDSIATKIIHITAIPKAKFSVSTNNCLQLAVLFKDQSVAQDETISKWHWDFGADTTANDTSNVQNPTFTYPKAGIYQVSLTVTTNLGCTNTFTKNVLINPLPVPDFTTPDICLNDAAAQFTNVSSIADGSHLTYLWDFGDPSSGTDNISTLQNPTHIYHAAAIYQVKLTVTSDSACVAEITKSFTVNGSIPKSNFTVQNENQLCSDQPVVFEDRASVDFGEITKIVWYFDDSDTSIKEIDAHPALRSDTLRTYSHYYPLFHSPLQKLVNVKMEAYSGTSCVSSITKSIVLKAVPNVVFDSIPPVCQEVPPFDITQASEKSGLSGKGQFTGDGITSNGLFSPAIAGIGLHQITYTFLADDGCTTVASRYLQVYPTPTVNAGADQTILVGGTVQFNGTVVGDSLIYQWIPSTGLNHDDILDPIASPTEDTKYILIAKSKDGCTQMDEVFIKVLQFPVISNTFTPNGDGINDTWNIKYLDSYPSVSVKVFDRYGMEVFKADNYSKPWDGKFNGVDLPLGTYYYIITANSSSLKYTGAVSIIR